ncbi:TRAP-type C4-dicarboxylate transport system, periplasmic component [Sphaerochaeta pleomorpha str. Grapes]|uniref:TRAP-type C4-dicarboxylate transport system, periplasmic component n=1 Tax=Sphaerochaeta pleomorpha (strain ATCC BAA-1885 / DSM 22778 / Grapes) TaxID=158190 RepID=G8QWG1_SPHPG|nr:TRAP transporter substrate-binding protein [Sphaerochaeta pleomorpha]AEV30537.1 TRAP-type C4-dicarboxylate transport system, periplasmic component [Sphaerochaeta pleomorpha str. Grapes]
MKRFLLVALTLVLVCFSCRKDQPSHPELVLRYADNQSSGYPTVEAAKYLAELVKERTGGRIELRVYPDSVLGSETSVMQQMSYGGIDMSRFSLGTLYRFFPELWTLQLPYLYTDNEHMWRVLDGEIGDMYLRNMSGERIVGLAWYDAGARSFYTRNPIANISSLKGLTIRVQENDMMSRTIELLGAEAVQIPYQDIYSALQKLRIDGAENNLPSYVFMDHNQAAPYFYQDEHFRLPEVVMISVDAQEKVAAVDPLFVDVLIECAKESGLYERKLWQEEEKRAYEAAVESGVIFTIPSKEDLLELKKSMEPLYEELSPQQREIVKRIGDA